MGDYKANILDFKNKKCIIIHEMSFLILPFLVSEHLESAPPRDKMSAKRFSHRMMRQKQACFCLHVITTAS
jgi:hypothetical protein